MTTSKTATATPTRPPLVIVVGVGALGSHVVQFLRNENAQVSCIDFDRIEQKNCSSQFYGRSQVGRLKAEALIQSMAFYWGCRYGAFPVRLTASNLGLLGGAALIIDCLDNAESRLLLSAYARSSSSPPALLHGCLAADGSFGRVVWDQWRDAIGGTHLFQTDEASAGMATCEDGQFLPFIVTVAGFIAQAAQRFLRDNLQVGFQVHPGGATRI